MTAPLAAHVGTAEPGGLTEVDASARLSRDGPNELPVSRPRSLLRLVRDVVTEPMFLLLVGCGAIYMVLGDRNEALMLLGFVFVVMGITFVQERRTERSLDALRDLASPQATVVRGGLTRKLPGRELVCDDLVLLAEGDRVPADMRLVAATNLTIDESMLTGESVPVEKHAVTDVAAAADTPEAAKTQTFSGTLVTQGTARGCVTATGERSALGRIGKSLEGLGGELTPTQEQTRAVVKRVAIVGLLLASGLAGVYALTTGDWLKGLLAGLTLAMAVLPEELPVILTLFLGLGAWRLAREKVLVRSIPAVELLGATTVLCVDKTGTLTANRMTVRRLWSETAAYECATRESRPLQEELHALLEFAVLASHRRAFDPMEAAIDDAGKRLLVDTDHLHGDWAVVADYPLSREVLAMTRVWQSSGSGGSIRHGVIAAKGAPEALVDLCHMSELRRAEVAKQVALFAAGGLRVLGVARATCDVDHLPELQNDFDFEFLGLVALEDPVRSDVPAAIAECRAAGIRVVMITGDHPATAASIARQAGLTDDCRVLTGAELSTLTDAELALRLADTSIFCRVQPDQKLRLVQAFRARGEVVAMTGDGVNDAPALKAANIGVAMGARGTDVAREAAALVLLNDDFSSLVTAVRYGRRVFDNLRKAIVFVVAVHVPIVGLSILPVLFGWPLILMPVHILFLQLIIDPACSVVFEAEPIEADAMTRPPRPREARLFDSSVLIRGLLQGAGLLGVLLGLYAWTRTIAKSDDVARALTFMVLVLSNLVLIFANRRWGRSASSSRSTSNAAFIWISVATVTVLAGILTIAPVSRLFTFTPPSPLMLLGGIGAVGLSWLWFEGVKWGLGRRHGPSGGWLRAIAGIPEE
jgi:Ca2+-transporting ATPase